MHCQQTFGKEAKNAGKSCYIEMKNRGDRFSNCGGKYVRYLRYLLWINSV